jgi:hypothetical protein
MGRKGRDVTLWVFRSFRFLEALVVGCLWRSGQQFSLKSRACHFSGKVRSDTLWFVWKEWRLNEDRELWFRAESTEHADTKLQPVNCSADPPCDRSACPKSPSPLFPQVHESARSLD